jgi:DNA polymerase-3 subunit beta
VLIPARDLAAVTKRPGTATITLALDSDTGYPPISNPPGTAAFTTTDRQVTMRLTAAEFPSYAKLIPAAADLSATVTADLAVITDALKRAAIVVPPKAPVRLAITPGEMHIDAGTGDDAGYAEVIPVDLDGDPQHIAFNPRYLLDALTAVAATGASAARIAITTPVKPALITPAEPGGPVACRHVLMPIRGTG